VRIVDVVRSYVAKTAEFDDWLVGEIAAKCSKEIAEFRQLEVFYNREHARVFGL
jgi:hypothetical protein